VFCDSVISLQKQLLNNFMRSSMYFVLHFSKNATSKKMSLKVFLSIIVNIFLLTTAQNHDRNEDNTISAKKFVDKFDISKSQLSLVCALCQQMTKEVKTDWLYYSNLSPLNGDVNYNNNNNNNGRTKRDTSKQCANDSVIVDYILGPKANYNNRNVPGGLVGEHKGYYILISHT
jgi:hypothetical protein